MRANKIIAFMVSIMLFGILAMTGCSPDEKDSPFVGSWLLSEMVEAGNTTSQEDIETLRSFGVEATAEFSEDGHAHVNFLGTEMDGTWEAVSASEAKATLDGQVINMSMDGEKLVMAQDNTETTLIFTVDNRTTPDSEGTTVDLPKEEPSDDGDAGEDEPNIGLEPVEQSPEESSEEASEK